MMGLAVLLAPVLISCEQEEPSVKFDVTTIDLKSSGGSQSFSITTNYDWSATTSDPWLQVSPTSGKKGMATLTVSADANDRGTLRKGSVTIACRDITRSLTVNQQPDLPQTLVIKHGNASFKAPVFTGSSVSGTIFWGDGSEETYSNGRTHTYASAGNYSVEIKAAGAYSFKVESVAGVSEIDFLNF